MSIESFRFTKLKTCHCHQYSCSSDFKSREHCLLKLIQIQEKTSSNYRSVLEMHFGCVFIGLIKFTGSVLAVLRQIFRDSNCIPRRHDFKSSKTMKFRKVIVLFTHAKTKAKRIQALYKYILFKYNGKRTIL